MGFWDTLFSDTVETSFLSKPQGRSQPDFSARLWAVDTAKEIFRFIHEKSRLREELEKHNKELDCW